MDILEKIILESTKKVEGEKVEKLNFFQKVLSCKVIGLENEIGEMKTIRIPSGNF